MQQRCVAGCTNCENAPSRKESLEARQAQLDQIIANPASSLGQIAGAKAERMDLAHDLQIIEQGHGTHVGNRATDQGETKTPRPAATDCTEYTVRVLREAFAAKGQSDAFNKILATAVKKSGGNLKGTEIIKQLQAQAGWKVLYWNPDTAFVEPAKAGRTEAYRTEHTYSAKVARGKKGTYYDIPIEKDKLVVDYAPAAGTGTTKDTSGLSRVKRIPFGVVVARGGLHVAMMVSGKIYEVHWREECTSENVFDVTPLESWAWKSGAVAAPAADVDAAWSSP